MAFPPLGSQLLVLFSRSLKIFWRKQEGRKSQNQDLRADPAGCINSGKIESRPGDFPVCRRLRAAASSSGKKGTEIQLPSGDRNFRRSDSSLLTNLLDSCLPVLCAPSFMSCEAMEFAETGHRPVGKRFPHQIRGRLHQLLWIKCFTVDSWLAVRISGYSRIKEVGGYCWAKGKVPGSA